MYYIKISNWEFIKIVSLMHIINFLKKLKNKIWIQKYISEFYINPYEIIYYWRLKIVYN